MRSTSIGTVGPQRLAGNVIKCDLLWVSVLIIILSLLLIPVSHKMFLELSKSHIYLMAFAKFAVLATMGELLAMRIVSGNWRCPAGILWRVLIWGILGALIALVFYLYATGVSSALANGLLPKMARDGAGAQVTFALLTSTLMNLLFAPTFMAFHRITDTYIDMGNGKICEIIQLKLAEVLERVDWAGFIRFVVCKTIPLFWIPAHTITFLLSEEHRVMAAAFLSIALGALLAFAKRQQNTIVDRP